MLQARVVGLGSGQGDDQAAWRLVRLLRPRLPPGTEVIALGEPSRLLDYLDGCGQPCAGSSSRRSAMHEVGVMQEALDLAIAEAERQGARHIHGITLRVGRLAGVEPEALAFAFEVVTAGTMAEGARLEIETVSVVCHCPDCRDEFRPADFVFACPRCGCLSLDVRHGDELELATLEVS